MEDILGMYTYLIFALGFALRSTYNTILILDSMSIIRAFNI